MTSARLFCDVLICPRHAGLDKSYSVNIKGTALMTKHVSKLMKSKARGGAVVNISSISAQIAQPGFVPYAMTKAAIAQMTRNCAIDLGQYNIRYTTIMLPNIAFPVWLCLLPGLTVKWWWFTLCVWVIEEFWPLQPRNALY
jgi:NAD(P)-dependent dehydrogenase (short-subunit alcohol dehydrogenase family)